LNFVDLVILALLGGDYFYKYLKTHVFSTVSIQKSKCEIKANLSFFHCFSVFFNKSKLRWRTPLQATGYVRATAPNSVKVDNNPKKLSLSRR
jgi:hypothetical protein